MPPTTLERRLAAIVGPAHVLGDPELCASYGRDVTGRFAGPAALVVRPGSTGEVSQVLPACNTAGVPVVPQGGNTGLVGGGVPRGGEVVLSLTQLDALGPVDPVAAQVTAGAGVTLERLQQHAAAAGLAFGVDHSARSGATVGGMVATNAGGAQVLRHGTMRAQVLGVEAVLADGRVVRRLAGLLKDNAGYDLAQLVIGSEGTLAVVTAARLRLVPAPAHVVTALLGVGSTGDAVDVMRLLRDRVASLNAVEIFYSDGLDLVCAHRRLAAPFARRHPVYVLAECASSSDPVDELAEALDQTPLLDVAVADDTARRRALWTYREAHNEAIAAAGIPHKLDVTVQLGDIAAFESRVRAAVADAAPGARTIVYGPPGRAPNLLCRRGRRHPAGHRAGAGAARRARRRGRARTRRRVRRLDQRGARGRRRQAAVAAPHALARRDRRDGGRQARARSARHPEPGCAVARTRRRASIGVDRRRNDMARPVTLFTGQWADLPLAELAAKCGEWGFDGLELACWGDHFDVAQAVSDTGYAKGQRELLARHGLGVWAIGNHLVGQAVCDPIAPRYEGMLPPEVWGDGEPEAVRQRAAEWMMDTARAAAQL